MSCELSHPLITSLPPSPLPCPLPFPFLSYNFLLTSIIYTSRPLQNIINTSLQCKDTRLPLLLITTRPVSR